MIINNEDFFTQGAIRALAYAANLAEIAGETELLPEHLLQALVDSESHAGEILEKHGFHRRNSDQPETVSENETSDTNSNPILLQPGFQVEEIFRHAKQLQQRWNHLDTIGTLHLLWGMVVTDNSVSRKFENAGLSHASLESVLKNMANENTDVIPVDFELFSPGEETKNVVAQLPNTNDPPVMRILDAAANRAREAFRVLEDYTRFVLDDAHLSSQLKSSRHEFAQALHSIDANRFLRMRDSVADVGTMMATATEYHRANIDEVLRANFKRLEESLRSLEEYAKTIDPSCGEKFERIRYGIYTLEKAVTITAEMSQRLEHSLLYFLLTKANCKSDPESVLREVLKGGVDLVQVREKELDDRELIAWGNRVREITNELGKLYVMNDRPDLAVLSKADGVHLGQEEMSVKEARSIVGPEMMIGISTHNIEQARQAVLDGADYIGVGPVFPSQTKSFDQYVGTDFLKEVAAEISLPAFAIGGIDATNVQQVVDAGIHRIAVTSAISLSDEPIKIVEQLKTVLKSITKFSN